MSEEIKNARDVIRDAFRKDHEFKEAYVANISMTIYDTFPEEIIRVGDHAKIDFCNTCAWRILNKIFME